MLERVQHDIEFVSAELGEAGLSVAFRRFGSSVVSSDPHADVDIAVISSDDDKSRVLNALFRLAKDERRATNWVIDVFDHRDAGWGYNSKQPGTLHFFLLDKQEYEGPSPIAENIRAAAT